MPGVAMSKKDAAMQASFNLEFMRSSLFPEDAVYSIKDEGLE
jgi:hypothetical protein